MSDVIGRAAIETVVDNTKLKVGIEEAKRSVKSLGAEVGTTMADGAARASSAIDSYIKKLELSATTVGKSTREIKLMELTQRGATDAQIKAADAALSTIEAHKNQQIEARKAGETARTAAAIAAAAQLSQANATKLTAFQTQQLSYQLNDFFVQIASGQNPMTALIQQGSQLNGTFGGFGGTLRALGSLFTVTRVAIGSVATVVGGLAYAINEGNNQSREFAKSITLTGNAAGATEGRFNSLAKTVADSTRTTIGSSRDVLQSLVSSGQFSGNALSETAKATQLMSKVSGESSDKVLKQFLTMTDGVAKWAETTNRSYHFLTAEQLKYIKSLEDQGDAQKAIEVTMQALNGRLSQTAQNVGLLESAWGKVKREASDAWNAMLGIGRQTTVDDQLSKLQKQLADREASGGPRRGTTRGQGAFEAGSQALREQIAALAEVQRLQSRSADDSARSAQTEQAKITFDKLREQSLTKQQKLAKEMADANALADKAGASAADRASVLAGIREKYKELDTTKPTLGLNIEKIKAELAGLNSAYKGSESILEATRSAGLLSEKDYYDAKRSFINLALDAEVSALQRENQLLQSAKVSSKDAIDNQKKVAENQAKINELRIEAAAKGIVLGIQQKGAVNQITRAYEEARIAAQDYLNTLTRQQGRELDAFPRGDKERARLSARQQIEDRYTQQRLDLENNKRLLEMEGKFNPDARKQYEDRLSVINEFQGKALDGWDKYYVAIGEKEANWANGASRAFENYLDNARNISKQSEDLFTNAFKGMEDAIVNFAMTGKLSFSDLAKSIIADMVRIQVRQNASGIFATLGKAALNYFTGPTYNTGGASLPGSFNPENAVGHAFDRGIQLKKYAAGDAFTNKVVNSPTFFNNSVMGEAGPEAIMPLRRTSDGSLGVMAAGGGGGDVSVSVAVDASGSKVEGDEPKSSQLGQMIGNAVRVVLVQEMRPGGLLAA